MSDLQLSVQRFAENVESVRSLSNLDRRVIDFAILALEKRDERLLKANVENPRLLVTGVLQQLRNIRQNDSLRPGFQELVNQCVVLLASYFSSGVSDLFRSAIPLALGAAPSDALLGHEIRVSVREARAFDFELQDQLGSLIADNADVSFQDLQSISRAFEAYLGIEIARDETANDIIAGLACRHVIVHNGAVVDRKCLQQLRDASPRRIKPTLKRDERIQFETDEVLQLSDSMLAYIERLAESLRRKLGPR